MPTCGVHVVERGSGARRRPASRALGWSNGRRNRVPLEAASWQREPTVGPEKLQGGRDDAVGQHGQAGRSLANLATCVPGCVLIGRRRGTSERQQPGNG